jgi:hypothetical protein
LFASKVVILVARELDRAVSLAFVVELVVLDAELFNADTCAVAAVITFAGVGICPIFVFAFVG